MAGTTYDEIRKLVAFSITNAKRRNVNQFMREYEFADGSILRIYKNGKASAASGRGDYKTFVSGFIRAQAWGS
jgi:hypothetical protein